MKVLHCSDIHLGRRPVGSKGDYSNKRYEDYFKAFDWIATQALVLKPDVLIIAGDFFDRREISPDVLARAEAILTKIYQNGIPVVLIEGNHDNITEDDDSWLLYLKNKGLLHRPDYGMNHDGTYTFRPYSLGDVDIYGLGYPGGFVNELLAEFGRYVVSKPERKNILVVHTAIGSDAYLPGLADKSAIDALEGKVIYIAGGHLHSFSKYPAEKPFFFIPGSSEYWNIDEKGSKGIILFDTESETIDFIESPKRKISVYEHNVLGSTAEPAFREGFEAFIKDIIIQSGEEIILVEIKASDGFYTDTAWCERQIEAKGALKAFVRLYSGEKDSAVTDYSTWTIDEIEREIISGWEFFGPRCIDVSECLQRLKQYQSEERKEIFIETFDKMLTVLMGSPEGPHAHS